MNWRKWESHLCSRISPTAMFAAAVDVNSIESCLANVRRSDLFLIVLSQRYGPSLAQSRVRRYLRNSPGIPGGTQRREEDLHVRSGSSGGGLHGMEAQLGKGASTSSCMGGGKGLQNIQSPRRTSPVVGVEQGVELVLDISRFGGTEEAAEEGPSGGVGTRDLGDAGTERTSAVPDPRTAELKIDFDQRRIDGTLRILNAGTAPALAPSLALWNNADDWIANLNSLLPGCSFELPLNFPLRQSALKERNARLKYELIYAIPEGHSRADEGVINVLWERGRRDFTASSNTTARFTTTIAASGSGTT